MLYRLSVESETCEGKIEQEFYTETPLGNNRDYSEVLKDFGELLIDMSRNNTENDIEY